MLTAFLHKHREDRAQQGRRRLCFGVTLQLFQRLQHRGQDGNPPYDLRVRLIEADRVCSPNYRDRMTPEDVETRMRVLRLHRVHALAHFQIHNEASAQLQVARVPLVVARGRIDAPGFFDDPAIRKAYTDCK